MRDLNEMEQAVAALLNKPKTDASSPLHDLHDPADIADHLKAERAALIAQLRQPLEASPPPTPLGGLTMARALSDRMDAVLTRMFELACERAKTDPTKLPMAIVATGGYGRRELCPFSDIDLTFIPQRDGASATDTVLREMFRLVMDVFIARCGLEVGYAYRLMEDCGSLDHQTTCGLLDARFITGSNRLFIQFEDAFWTAFNPAEFIFAKLEERDLALAKWGYSPRVVEPQLKEGPGGLRDFQTAVWVAQARGMYPAARVRGERAFDALLAEGDLPEEDIPLLAAAKERLFQVRNALHALAGAERDQLVITRQEDVATILGYLPPDEKGEEFVPPVERFLGDLYPQMVLIRRTADQVMRRVSNRKLLLSIGLDCKRRQIMPANKTLASADPIWLLWACDFAQRYRLTLSESLERTAIRLVRQNPEITDPGQYAQVFTQILSHVGRIYPTLQKMADLGILNWILPEFGQLMDLIPYDPSHDYTVGQHSLYVIRNLEALLESAANEEEIEMRDLLKGLPHPEQLMLAALLHDAGKATPGRPHAEISDEIAEVVCRRFGWSDEATANVRFLVREHLIMAETSRLRDLNLEETIRDFIRIVDEPDRLHALYLLTYADTRAVGEGVWTQVKGRFLQELWRKALALLSEEETGGYDDAAIARARRRLLKELAVENLPEAEITEHVQAMSSQHLLNLDIHRIALQIGFVRKVREGEIVVDFHDDSGATYTELTLCAYDDPEPGLLAKIAGALYAADVNVHTAQVMTRVTERDRIALDTLWVDYRGRQLSPGKRREVTQNLTAALTGKQTVQELLQKRRGTSPQIPSALSVLSVRNDLSETLTFLELGGADVRGTFYHSCAALSALGWDIYSARLSTWREEARAGFYVRGARRLSESAATQALEHSLAQIA